MAALADATLGHVAAGLCPRAAKDLQARLAERQNVGSRREGGPRFFFLRLPQRRESGHDQRIYYPYVVV
jgi:hypothetical protein